MNSKTKERDIKQQLSQNPSYQMALDLAEQGSHTQALEIIEEYLSSSPEDSEALNDAGVILHCQGKEDRAIEYLCRAREINPESGEIIWNLCEAYLSAGQPEEAQQLFEEMDRLKVLNVDVLNRTANEFLDKDNLSGAAELLERSLQIMPEQEILTPMIEVIRSKMSEANEIN